MERLRIASPEVEGALSMSIGEPGRSGREPAAHDSERAFMMRSLGVLWAIGSVLFLALVSAGHSPPGSRPWLLAIDGLGFVTSATILSLRTRFPWWGPDATGVLGTAIITAIIALYADQASPFALYYFWLTLHSFYFLPWRRGAIQIVTIYLAYAGVLIALGSFPIQRWVMIMGTLTVSCTLVGALRARVDRLVARLAEMARRDPLTGLCNRRGLSEALERELAGARRYGTQVGLVVCDVDLMKALNDTEGHAAGDDALRAIADILTGEVREVDTVFRAGGDEFGMVLPNTDGEAAVVVAERVRAAVKAGFRAATIPLTISLGVAVCPRDGSTQAELFRVADASMYEAKRRAHDRTERQRATAPGQPPRSPVSFPS